MAITVLQRPLVYYPDSGSGTDPNKWNAVGNPIIYKFNANVIAYDSYRLEVEVYNGLTNALLTEDPFEFIPDETTHDIIADISVILRAYLSPNNNINALMDDDTDVYLKFYIKYREVWTGSANGQTNDSANKFFAILAAKQIPSTYGGNMAEYSAYDGGTVVPKFLTKLDTPVMWRDYPFFLSLIVPEDLDVNTEFYAVGSSVDVIGAAGDNSEKVLTVNLFGSDVEGGDEFDIYLRQFPTNTVKSEIKTVEVRDACLNPVMLLARNSLGGILQWMFEYNQEEVYDFGGSIKNRRQTLTANGLTINQWQALHDFITLGDVYRENIVEFSSSTIKTQTRVGQQVYVLEADGTKTGVIVIPTKNKTNTKQKFHKFEIEIEYPEVFQP